MTSSVVAVVVIIVLLLVALRLLWSDSGHVHLDDSSNVPKPPARLVSGFREICRTVLDPNVLAFLPENVPADISRSFLVRQGELALFSLQVASGTLFQRVIGRKNKRSTFSFRHTPESLISQIESGVLLVVCGLGRASLWLLQSLRYGIPKRVHLWVQAHVLSSVAGLMSYFAADADSRVTALAGEGNVLAQNSVPDGKEREDFIVADVWTAMATTLPNDLSRMICLATLRDNNTGGYYHPELTRRFSIEASDHAMLVCHQKLFDRLVSLALEDLTDQLDVYFVFSYASKARSIENWKKLRAYRATIPIDADPISAEILFMKVEVALAILEARISTRI